jgi:hypothetical protein
MECLVTSLRHISLTQPRVTDSICDEHALAAGQNRHHLVGAFDLGESAAIQSSPSLSARLAQFAGLDNATS